MSLFDERFIFDIRALAFILASEEPLIFCTTRISITPALCEDLLLVQVFRGISDMGFVADHALFILHWYKLKNEVFMSTEKNKRFAGLIVPFSACPFEKVEDDCPFVEYWTLEGLEEIVEEINNLSEEKLLYLHEHHSMCRDRKIKAGEPIVNL